MLTGIWQQDINNRRKQWRWFFKKLTQSRLGFIRCRIEIMYEKREKIDRVTYIVNRSLSGLILIQMVQKEEKKER